MRFSKAFTSTALLTLLLWHGAPAIARAGTMRDLIETYQADSDLLSRHWSISGDSDAELTRETKLLHDWQARMKAVDFEKLPGDQRVEYVLLRNELDASLTSLSKRKAERQELSGWLPMRAAIDTLADSRVRGEPLVPENAGGMIAPLAEKITKLQEQLKAAKEAAKQPQKPASSAPEGALAAWGGFEARVVGADASAGAMATGKGCADCGVELIMGIPPEPRLILILKPSSSNSNSLSSERFIKSMICLICFRSKQSPWLN